MFPPSPIPKRNQHISFFFLSIFFHFLIPFDFASLRATAELKDFFSYTYFTMSGDSVTDGKPKVRPVLGDITNRSVKRGFSSLSDDSGFHSKEEADSQSTKQVCLGVENLIKEKPKKPQSESNPNYSSACSGEIDTSKENLALVDDKIGAVREGIDLSDSDDTEEQVEGVGVGRVASSKAGCIEWSRPFDLERCVRLKNDGCMNLNAEVDMLKACSCSFCFKAAYIWSDLHYQDIKGRIAVLKKSQKEASILVQKSGRGKQTEIGNGNRSSKLEPDLTSQWRSLFLNMGDIFVHESNELQASYVALKDLRENCKMDLERMTGMPSEK